MVRASIEAYSLLRMMIDSLAYLRSPMLHWVGSLMPHSSEYLKPPVSQVSFKRCAGFTL